MVPVVDRHTSDEPGAAEPAILGYACNFKLGRIGKVNPRPAILCDLKIKPEDMDRVKQRPRRSIELWPDLVIDPVVLMAAKEPAIDKIALLGAQRPARDLGMLFYKNLNGRDKYRYEIPVATKENMNPEELVTQCLEALKNLPEFAFIRDLMEKSQGEAGEGAEEFSEEEDEKVKMEDAAEMEADEDKVKEEKDCEPAKLRMQRDQERRKYARLETQYKALFAKVDALERDKRLADRKADLLALEGEGYDFDISEELDYVGDMEPLRYSKHLNKIKKSYRKAPVGVNITPARVQAEGGRATAVATPGDVYAKAANLYKTGRTFDKNPQEAN